MKIRFELDVEVNALYVRFDEGEVARTLEVEETLFIDVGEHGETLGIEFVDADDFLLSFCATRARSASPSR